MERLRPRWQATQDDAHGDGVSPPILPARTAEGLCQDSSLWFSVKPISRLPTGIMPAVAGNAHARTAGVSQLQRKPFDLALPTLRRANGRSAETHRRGSLAVRLLRFVITPRPAEVQRRANGTLADLCVRLPSTALPIAAMGPRRPVPPPSQPRSHIFVDRHYGQHQPRQYQSGFHSP